MQTLKTYILTYTTKKLEIIDLADISCIFNTLRHFGKVDYFQFFANQWLFMLHSGNKITASDVFCDILTYRYSRTAFFQTPSKSH